MSSPLPDLVDVEADAPVVSLRWSQARITENRLERGADRIVLSVPRAGRIEVRRAPSEVIVALDGPASPEAIVHPVAATALAVLAAWRGHCTLHAGAVLHRGRAIALCGVQGSGKSSALATLARRGHPVVADDLLVIDGHDVHAGPSCVDLRADTAARFPAARFIGTIGARERYRLATPPAPARVPLAAIVQLAFSADDDCELRPLDAAERLRLLHSLDYGAFTGLFRAEATLDLITLPMWRFSRPRDFARAEASLGHLLQTVGAH